MVSRLGWRSRRRFSPSRERRRNSSELELQFALGGDAPGVGHGLGHVGERLRHFVGRLVVQFLGLEAHPALVVHLGLGLDAQQHVVGFHVAGFQVVAVVGGDKGQPGVVGEFQQLFVQLVLFLQAVGLQFQVVVAGVDGLVLAGDADGVVHGAPQQRARHLPGKAGGQGGDAARILAQQVHVHARLVVEAVQEAVGHQLDQVVVAFGGARQQHQMVAHPGQLRGLVRVVVRHVDLAADDRLYAELLAGIVEVDRAVKVAVVGDGGGGHAEVHRLGAEVLQADGPVEQAVFGMAVQMDELDVFPTRAAQAGPRGRGGWPSVCSRVNTDGCRVRFRGKGRRRCRDGDDTP